MNIVSSRSGELTTLTKAFVVFLALLASACAPWDKLKAGARVSPILARNSTPEGQGGYLLERDKNNIDVRELRTSMPKPVNLDNLRLPRATGIAYVEAQENSLKRNRLQDYLLRTSDDVCLEHKTSILAISSASNTVLSELTTIFGGLGAVLTGVNASRALSAAAAISNGSRDNVNEHLFYNNVASAIVRQIDRQRQQVLQELEPKRALDTITYSVDESIRDVARYHNLCSFSEAVAALATDEKRPSSANELRGRLATLRAEFQTNSMMIQQLDATTNADTVKALRNTNTSIAKSIQALTLQLSLVEGASVAASEAPLNPATPILPSNSPMPSM